MPTTNPTATPTSFQARISKCFADARHSDITIFASDGTSFPAHLIFLATYTNFFTDATSSSFLEASTKTVTLPEHAADAISAFLQLCYSGEYTTYGDARLDLRIYKLLDYILAPDEPKIVLRETLKSNLAKGLAGIDGADERFWDNIMPEILAGAYAADGPAWKELQEDVTAIIVVDLRTGRFWGPFRQWDVEVRNGKLAVEMIKRVNVIVARGWELEKHGEEWDIKCAGFLQVYSWNYVYRAITTLTCKSLRTVIFGQGCGLVGRMINSGMDEL